MTVTDAEQAFPPTPPLRHEVVMSRRTSHASSVSSRTSSSSLSSSYSSSAASSSRGPPSTLPVEDIYELDDVSEQVYVTSSSAIVLGQTAKEEEDSNIYDTAYDPCYYNASLISTSSSTTNYDSASRIRSIFYESVNNTESQEISCFLEEEHEDTECEKAEPEEDTSGSPGGGGADYEGIYEVISPNDDDDDEDVGQQEFDNIDQHDNYSILHNVANPSLDTACSESVGRDDKVSQHSITKIAEAANIGMRRLRRNWSLTKNEVRTGFNKIKKKSTFNISDVKTGETNRIARDSIITPTEDKRKWSFKSHFRRKSSPSLSPTALLNNTSSSGSNKETATFYLTLTIETDQANKELAKSKFFNNPAADQLLISTKTPSTLPNTKLKSLSSSNILTGHSSSLARPTAAPPLPPKVTGRNSCIESPSESEGQPKDKFTCRLNQLLSQKQEVPPGRKVLKSLDSPSSETSPVPVLIYPSASSTEQRSSSVKYASIDTMHTKEDKQAASSDINNFMFANTPQSRHSVASSTNSSDSYVKPADIAFVPPPLPARRNTSTRPPSRTGWKLPSPAMTPVPSSLPECDSQNYLDLNYDIEDEPLYVSSQFANEPLYQIYTANVLERATMTHGDYSSEDDYEVINDGESAPAGGKTLQSRPSAMEIVTPVDGRRTLWCELPEVVQSGILNKLSNQEKKVQEAMFEVITSEASYLKSLNVLITHFMQCHEFNTEREDCVITRREKEMLFSNILPVRRCSELFLADLENRWQESIVINSFADVVQKAANSHFNVYIKYCSQQIHQHRILKELKDNNPQFVEVLTRLESAPVCQSLAMHSFLMLPMQRITRLPLLIDAIFHRLEYGSPQWWESKLALATLTDIVAKCNEGARNMERMEEMLIISRQLDFREVKAIPLISASRWLVKKGEMTRLTCRDSDAKLTFGKRISKNTLYFFLFTDLLVITKKRSEDQYIVLDYCPRNMVQVLELDGAEKFPQRFLDGHKNLLIMTMLQNHENKTVEMVLSCPLESDRTRWMEAVTPRTSENPDERIYEEWDCPQVQARHPYVAQQPDELSLEVCDVVNVLKKMMDGWYQGERLRDGERGWFPGNYTIEIASAHVRARNLRQRHRLLTISGNLIEELRKAKERFEKEEGRKERRKTLPLKDMISSQTFTS